MNALETMIVIPKQHAQTLWVHMDVHVMMAGQVMAPFVPIRTNANSQHQSVT